MPLKNCDYLVSKGAEIIINWMNVCLEWDMCFTLEWNNLEEIQKIKGNILNSSEQFPLKIKIANGIMKIKVNDLLTEH